MPGAPRPLSTHSHGSRPGHLRLLRTPESSPVLPGQYRRGAEGPAPVASWAQMAGAMAASWTSPLGRSRWGDSPPPIGLWKPGVPALLGFGLPPPLRQIWQVPASWDHGPMVGPGPWKSWARCWQPDEPTAHHGEHPLWLRTRMTGSDSFSWGTVPPARAPPRGLTGWRQPETAGPGLPVGGEGVPAPARHGRCG